MQNKTEPQNTHFTLTMLGTDTQFTLPGDDTSYPKGETLSLISTQIQTQNPIIDKKETSQYQANEVEVIRGPETTGSNVTDRIGRGTSAILKALLRGQTNVSLIAHSRGAVESILIAHELQVIKDYLENNPNTSFSAFKNHLENTEKNRDTGNTPKDVIKTLFSPLKQGDKAAINEKSFSQLKDNIKQLSIHLFAIDPVPGNPGLGYTWYDARYFTLPPVVKKAEVYYYENERTNWGFAPIHTKATDEKNQHVAYFSIPGHHGTGSAGNSLSQQGEKVSDKKTTHVQKLLLLKLHRFLSANGAQFKPTLDIYSENKKKLGKKYIAQNEDKKTINYPKSLRSLYGKVLEFKPGYEAYNKTGYAVLKSLSTLPYRQILTGMDSKKYHIYDKYENIFPKTQAYVNNEHAELMQDYFFEKFGLKGIDFQSLDQLVNQVNATIVNAIMEAAYLTDDSGFEKIELNELDNTTKPKPNLAQSMVSLPLPLLANSTFQDDVLKTYQILIHQISQKYLATDWSTAEQLEAKKQLFTEIKKMLSDFGKLETTIGNNEKIKSFVQSLIANSAKGIQETIDQQYLDIDNRLKQIQSWPDNELEFFFKEILSNFDHKMSDTKVDQLIKQCIQTNASEFHSVEDKIRSIYKALNIQALPLNKSIELADYSLENVTNAFNQRFGQKFKDYQKLYHQIKTFLEDIEGVLPLHQSFQAPLEHYGYQLTQQINAFIDTAAKRFYSDKPFNPQITPANDTFEELVQRHAIKHYGLTHPLQKQLDEQKQNYEQLLRLAEQKHDDSICQIQTSHGKEIKDWENQLSEQKKSTETLKTNHQKELTDAQDQLTKQQEEAKQTLQKTQTNHQKELTDAQDKLTKQQEEAKQTLQKTQANHQKELTDAQDQLTKQQEEAKQTLQKTQTNHQKELTAAQDQLTKQQEEAKQTLQKTQTNHQKELTDAQDQLTKQQEEAKQTLQKIQANHQKELTAAQDQLTKQQEEAQKTLQKIQETHKKELDTLKQQKEILENIVNDPKEAENLLLINKLHDLSTRYMTHLTKAGQDNNTPKVKAVKALIACLDNKADVPQPSERVKNFYRLLNQCEDHLKAHRDTTWKRYVKNTLIAGGILLTGILPGLLALAIYANTGERKSGFFWKSQGNQFVEQIREDNPQKKTKP